MVGVCPACPLLGLEEALSSLNLAIGGKKTHPMKNSRNVFCLHCPQTPHASFNGLFVCFFG